MADHMNPESGSDRARRSEPTAPSPSTSEPSVDRQVALGPDGRPAPVVQQWLDGERPEAEARRANAGEVELWTRLNEETERRRRMTTPTPTLERIMAAIPDTRPSASAALPARTPGLWQRTVSLSVPALAAAGAGLLTVGALLGALLR